MSLIPVPYSKSVGVLSCVSIIAQSCAIDKVYLISRLHNALWNCYFWSKLLFQSLYFLKVLTYTLSQEVLFQRIFRTANFQQVTSWSFYTLRYPGGCTEWWTTQKIFPLNTMTKTFASKLLPQGSIKPDKLSTMQKIFVLRNFNKISISVQNFRAELAKKPTI